MLFAADQMCNIGVNFTRESATIDLYPLPNLLNGTKRPKVPSDRNSEGLERGFHDDNCLVLVKKGRFVDVSET